LGQPADTVALEMGISASLGDRFDVFVQGDVAQDSGYNSLALCFGLQYSF